MSDNQENARSSSDLDDRRRESRDRRRDDGDRRREGGGDRQRGGSGRYSRSRRDGGRRRRGKVCQFCMEEGRVIDYKDIGLLRHMISERGRILPRRRTGTCAKHQRVLSQAIKRARHIALLPYTAEHVRLG